jgi:hypothetical protein
MPIKWANRKIGRDKFEYIKIMERAGLEKKVEIEIGFDYDDRSS